MYNDDNKNIEIVSGNGKDLDISPVYDNLDIAKPEDESNTKKNVIIPEEKNLRIYNLFCFCNKILHCFY